MPDLFFDSSDPTSNQSDRHQKKSSKQNLASRLRPQNLDEIIGQEHLLEQGQLLRRALDSDCFSSLIFYGPPGTGKTSLARCIAKQTGARFESLHGVESNVSDLRKKIETAQQYAQLKNQETIIFIDELHRFTKSQQDVLLPYLEEGDIRFIGATTHNPYFYLNGALISRSQIFQLNPLSHDTIIAKLKQALSDKERGFSVVIPTPISVPDEALHHLATYAEGDARKALNALELAVLSTANQELDNQQLDNQTDNKTLSISLTDIESSIQQKALKYSDDDHYDIISAFIKSIRGSDPDAALYWLAKMLESGEDPRFITRRLVISASEDIGLADSNALRVANDAFSAFELVGMPEGRIPLAHATVYLATAPKSNSAYMGINQAISDVKSGESLAVPEHLKTKSRKKLAKSTGVTDAEQDYLYSHDGEDNYIPQAYLPEGKSYYTPTHNGLEKRIAERLDHLRKLYEKE